jgi:hypothetical protein
VISLVDVRCARVLSVVTPNLDPPPGARRFSKDLVAAAAPPRDVLPALLDVVNRGSIEAKRLQRKLASPVSVSLLASLSAANPLCGARRRKGDTIRESGVFGQKMLDDGGPDGNGSRIVDEQVTFLLKGGKQVILCLAARRAPCIDHAFG